MNHRSKQLIRSTWCRPLVQFFHERLGSRLTYLGLPSPEAHDVLCWIDHVERVIAFQCRKYGRSSSIDQDRGEVEKLEIKLLELERENKIAPFALYDGYIEEVLIKGWDTTGATFEQTEPVTVYNLDFCNGITTPIRYVDANNQVQEAFKSEAIRRLLELQRDTCRGGGHGKFIMFLTVHSSFLGPEQERWVREQGEDDIREYIEGLSALDTREKQMRELKAYVFQIVREFFRTTGFSPECLPVLYYLGAGGNWLVHFTIVGVANRNAQGIAPCYQTPRTFLQQAFLQVRNDHLSVLRSGSIDEEEPAMDLVTAFQRSSLYAELWSE